MIAYGKQIELVKMPLSIESQNPKDIVISKIDIQDNDPSISGGVIGEENRKSALENFKKKYPEKFDQDGNYKDSFFSKKSPKIGMTRGEVLESTWGEPFSKRSIESRYGVTETWNYRSLGSITISNGVVEFIHRRD